MSGEYEKAIEALRDTDRYRKWARVAERQAVLDGRPLPPVEGHARAVADYLESLTTEAPVAAQFAPVRIAEYGLLWLHSCGRTQPYQEGTSPQAGMCIGCLRFGHWRQLYVIDD